MSQPRARERIRPELNVEWWPISKPIPYARNARRIPQSAIDKVAASIKEFSWRQPIVVDTNRVILAGHTRLLAAQKLGMKKVPVHVAKNLTVMQAKAYRLADNRSGQEASWDHELLALELEDLKVDEFDLALTAFSADELITLTAPDPTFQGMPAPDTHEENWQGMPALHQDDLSPKASLVVNFRSTDDKNAFAALIGQQISETKKSVWYPAAEVLSEVGSRFYLSDAPDAS